MKYYQESDESYVNSLREVPVNDGLAEHIIVCSGLPKKLLLRNPIRLEVHYDYIALFPPIVRCDLSLLVSLKLIVLAIMPLEVSALEACGKISLAVVAAVVVAVVVAVGLGLICSRCWFWKVLFERSLRVLWKSHP